MDFKHLFLVRKLTTDECETKINIPQNVTTLRCLPKLEVSVLFLFGLC